MPVNWDRVHQQMNGWSMLYVRSRNLRWSAKILHAGLQSEELLSPMKDEIKDYFANIDYIQNNCDRHVALLYGYAVEVILKAIQARITGKYTHTHNSRKIAESLSPLSFSNDDLVTFEVLSMDAEWAGRYTTGKSSSDAKKYQEKRGELALKHSLHPSPEILDDLWLRLKEKLHSNVVGQLGWDRERASL